MTPKNPNVLKDELTTDGVVEHWTEVIQDRIADDQRRENLREWIETYRDETLAILEDVGDSEDVHTSLVLRYIEMKCQWIIFNNQIQYQTVETGSPDETMVVKASLLSNLLEKLEEWLDEDKVESITELLSQPVDALSNRF